MWQWGLIGGSVVAPAVPPAQLSDGFGGPGIASKAKRQHLWFPLALLAVQQDNIFSISAGFVIVSG